MKRLPMTYLATIAVLALIGNSIWNVAARAGYESAEYKVIESDGDYEIREYPDLTLASTTATTDAKGRDSSFMKLFNYISGANQSEQQIPMTTPVFMESPPATDEGRTALNAQMGFVIPKQVATEGVPAPNGADVKIHTRKGGRFAVIRFSGRMSPELAKESEARLRAWMGSKHLIPDAESDSPNSNGVESAAYDPPFTPGPLRRNEILIRLQ
ncbi:MAG: SOUL family heme-binding protein [Planctomycetaceae bacterium]